jgi:hypothetical protein
MEILINDLTSPQPFSVSVPLCGIRRGERGVVETHLINFYDFSLKLFFCVIINFLICNFSFAQTKKSFASGDEYISSSNDSTWNLTYRPAALNSTYSEKPKLSLKINSYNLSNLEFDPLEKEINYPILTGLGVVYLGAGIGVHLYQRNAWWKDDRTSFHFQTDWPYALWIDKIGHFYAATLLAHAFSVGLEAADVQSENAMIYGSIAALAFQYYVEIEDGFGKQWGFSPGDAIANTLGVGYALAQYYHPYLQNFQFKYSYYPSKEIRNGTHKGNAIDDYEGQKYWLSFRMKELLPNDISSIWPSFLNIAVGYGVNNLDGSGGGEKEVYIALDLEAQALPFYGEFGQFVKNTLNYFHFPLPGIKITPNTVFFVFCY